MLDEEDYPTERSEFLVWAAAAVERAYEWPTVPTVMFGLILLSRPLGPYAPGYPLYRERLFIGQCPTTRLIHVETHIEMKAPALADFTRRATETIEGLRADTESLPTRHRMLKPRRPEIKDWVTMVSRTDTGKSASIRRLLDASFEPLPGVSRTKKR